MALLLTEFLAPEEALSSLNDEVIEFKKIQRDTFGLEVFFSFDINLPHFTAPIVFVLKQNFLEKLKAMVIYLNAIAPQYLHYQLTEEDIDAIQKQVDALTEKFLNLLKENFLKSKYRLLALTSSNFFDFHISESYLRNLQSLKKRKDRANRYNIDRS